MVPYLYFTGQTHLDVCELLASHNGLGPTPQSVYINFLFTRSDKARQITALIKLVRVGKLRVRSVTSDFIGPEFADLLGDGICINLRTPRNYKLINIKQFIWFFVKILLHRFYHLLRHRGLKSNVVVRAWHEGADHAYPEIVKSATLLLYPVAGNLLRHIRYYRLCRTKGRSISIMGLPYRLLDIPKILLRWKNRERLLVEAEAYGFRKHAQEINAMGVDAVYTTDECEMASGELHGMLMDHGVKCVNSSHGIANYGPFVKYTHWSFYNEQQLLFYRKRSCFESCNVRTILPPEAKPRTVGPSEYDPIVVYAQGNWLPSGKLYEARLEKEAVMRAKKACKELGLSLVIKAHPNMRTGSANRLHRQYGVDPLRRMEDISDRHPIFLNLLSTSYYTFMLHGPALLLMNDLIHPQDIFGYDAHCVRLEDIQAELAQFRDSAFWVLCHRQQIEHEKLRTSQ
jgi:hypothetical protein